jgi:hypothetical protein
MKVSKVKVKKVAWNDEFYVQVYQLAKSGANVGLIANTLGVRPAQFRKWMDDRPALGVALQEGVKRDNSMQANYIFGCLSEKAKRVWERVCKAEKQKSSLKKIELLFDEGGDGIRKELFLHVFSRTYFNATEACRKVRIPYKVFKRWVEEDPEFSGLIAEMQDHKGDLYESRLTEVAVEDRDVAALIFCAKTYNRKRGYNEKLEIEHSGSIKNDLVIELGEELLDRLSQGARREILEVSKQMQIESAKSVAQEVVEV